MTSFNAPLTFDLNETFRRIVEKCVLATANRLVNIEDSTKKIKHFIKLFNLFIIFKIFIFLKFFYQKQ